MIAENETPTNENPSFTRKFDTFVPPELVDIRKKYTHRVEKANAENKWPATKVFIERNNLETGESEVVFEYERNYSFYKTFEPFRQFNNGEWRDYALISTKYVRFEVVDLEKGEIIAIQPAPTVTEEHHKRWRKMGYEKWCEEQPVGTEKPGWGFCPVEFYVPDWLDNFGADAIDYTFNVKEGEEPRYLYPEEDFLKFTGQYAIYSGCVWGDDSGGWKIRYIDLSRISEGIVTSDERFGYIRFAGKSLKEIEIWNDSNRMVVPVEMYVDIPSGKAFKIEANWLSDDEEDKLDD